MIFILSFFKYYIYFFDLFKEISFQKIKFNFISSKKNNTRKFVCDWRNNLFLSLILSISYFYSTNTNIIYFNLFLIIGFL